VAVKRLNSETAPAAFLQEYKSLLKVSSPGHPNIIQTISAEVREDATNKHGIIQRFGFIFPLALGNFKELLRGSLETITPIENKVDSLWGELEGLASAVEYLHKHCRMVHRDIKPSNILVYDDSSLSGLKAKITDFGLAIDFERVKVFNPGTKELQSAVDYDAPELRRRLRGKDSSQKKPPNEKEISSGDIWKLGAVWVELVTYLILGSHGVNDFRKFITVTEGNLRSDTLARFDDGDRVKPEVLEWLKSLSTRSPRATEMELLLTKMLADADSRPDASEVVAKVRLVSAAKSGLGTHAYIQADVILFLLGRRQCSSIHPR
jgi:serine/threonine protein kinase